MTRVPHIIQTREQIAKRIKLGEKIEVEYTHRSEGRPDTNCSGYITHVMDDRYRPFLVEFSNNKRIVFTDDGYDAVNSDNSYITLLEEKNMLDAIEKGTNPKNNEFEKFMVLAVEEGMTLDSALRLYRKLKK